MATKKAASVTKTMQMGLGEAVQRLFRLESKLKNGFSSVLDQDRDERRMILDALNTHKLDLGFDCDADGVPDTIEIFARSAETSCCKIVSSDTSRSASVKSSRRTTKASPRRTKTKE